MKIYTDKDKQNLEYGFAILNDDRYYSAKKGSEVRAEEGSKVINESDIKTMMSEI